MLGNTNKATPKMQFQNFTVLADEQGTRLDHYLTEKTELTRSQIKKACQKNQVLIDKKHVSKPGTKLREGMEVHIQLVENNSEHQGQDIPLDILFENDSLLFINKDPGIVVHPDESGHSDNTLVNAIIHHDENISNAGPEERPGIVHRLDKDTSGVMVIAKNQKSFEELVKAFQNRTVGKTYMALVKGHLKSQKGEINAPIKRANQNRKQMCIHASGKEAITQFEVIDEFNDSSLLEVKILTGRTHQIRLHLASIGHPVIGDTTYGEVRINKKYAKNYDLNRQFLHAHKLKILGEAVEAPLKKDLNEVLLKLQ